jgi:hypothetical protein
VITAATAVFNQLLPVAPARGSGLLHTLAGSGLQPKSQPDLQPNRPGWSVVVVATGWYYRRQGAPGSGRVLCLGSLVPALDAWESAPSSSRAPSGRSINKTAYLVIVAIYIYNGLRYISSGAICYPPVLTLYHRH